MTADKPLTGRDDGRCGYECPFTEDAHLSGVGMADHEFQAAATPTAPALDVELRRLREIERLARLVMDWHGALNSQHAKDLRAALSPTSETPKPENGPLTRGSSASAVEPLPAYVRSDEARPAAPPTTSAEAVLPGGTEDSVPIERCSDCGIEQPVVWTAPDDLYVAVMGRKDGDTPCPTCFDTRAAAQGRFLRWVPREETPE